LFLSSQIVTKKIILAAIPKIKTIDHLGGRQFFETEAGWATARVQYLLATAAIAGSNRRA
jgi:hypothetical protein